jgi:sugar phosphate isomerase/epimerase
MEYVMPVFALASSLFVVDKENMPTGDPAKAIGSIAAHGFRKTELLADGIRWKAPEPGEVSRLRTALEQFEVEPATIHTPMKGIDLTSPDSTVRKDSIERIKEAMRFGAEMGAHTAIVHPTGKPGSNDRAYSFENLGESVEYAFDSVSSLVKVAQEVGIRIALENLSGVQMACRPLETMEQLRAFIAGFPAAHVGLCLDVGHSCISGFDPAQQARVGADRLCALHIHDVDGSRDCHWVPGQGVIDWSSLAQALSEIGFAGDWTMEVLVAHSESPPDALAKQCGVVRQLWDENGMCNPS